MSIDVPRVHQAAAALGPRAFAALLGRKPADRGRRDEAVVRCFVHADDNPSCTIIVKGGRLVWRCHACNVGGDAIRAAAEVWGMDYQGRGFPEVARRLADLLGVREVTSQEARAPRPQVDPLAILAKRIDRAADAWIDARSIPPSEAREIERSIAKSCAAMRLLSFADRRRHQAEDARLASVAALTNEDRDAELDRLADAHEAAQAPTTTKTEAA